MQSDPDLQVFPTAAKAMEALVRLDIAREVTWKQRNRVFVYGRYLDIMSERAATR